MYALKKLGFTGKLALAFVIGLFFAILLSSCEEHVTPDKVSRKISQDSWVITSFIHLDSSVVNDYTNKLFGFGESGSIIVQSEPGVGGHWSVGLNKKPTILYITNFVTEPYTRLNDDWEVLTCSSDKITLQSDNGAFTNKLTLIKYEL